MLVKYNASDTVDRLGETQARIADLQKQVRELKDDLIGLGAGTYEGAWFSATVSEFKKGTLDMKAVRAKLSTQFITAHTTYEPETRVSVKARKASMIGGVK